MRCNDDGDRWRRSQTIIFVNLLIAMMGDSFSEFSGAEGRDSIARWERAKIICRAEEFICNYNKSCFDSVNRYFFDRIRKLRDNYKEVSSRQGSLRTYLLSDYDDPDTEPEISTTAVRTQILQAVARLAQGQDDMKMKMKDLEASQQRVGGPQRLNTLRSGAGGRMSPGRSGTFR